MKPWFLFFLLLPVAVVRSQTMSWNCALALQDKEISFSLHKKAGSNTLQLVNGKETIVLDQWFLKDDSINYPLSVFDAVLRIPFPIPDPIAGRYCKLDSRIPGYFLPFRTIVKNQSNRSDQVIKQPALPREWKCIFSEDGLAQDSGYMVLEQNNNSLHATILTNTGDYRFLNGEVKGNKAFLQTFDGGHTYHFEMTFHSSFKSWEGAFYYGRSGSQTFSGHAVSGNFLPDGFNKPPSGSFHFSALDSSGKQKTDLDPEWKGKALVVQIMGTWCPNCLDESRFLVEAFSGKPDNVAFVGLAFERKNDPQYAWNRIGVVKKKLRIPYPVYWAGISNKDSATKALQSQFKITSFPTTVFVRKDGTILKIHYGFSGPATGFYYDKWKQEFAVLLKELSGQ
jgi:thiol-disulfide isomerase/thioredoxin